MFAFVGHANHHCANQPQARAGPAPGATTGAPAADPLDQVASTDDALAWGCNENGQLGQSPPNAHDVAGANGSAHHVTRADGTGAS